MRDLSPVDRLESADALDRLTGPLRSAVNAAVKPQVVRDALHGVWLGHPLHPLLVQGTLGALLSASVLDAVPGTERAATTLVAVGVASAPAAVASGATDWSELHEQQQRVGVVHAAANAGGLLLYAASLASRLRGRHAQGRALGWAGLAVLGAGGYLGGHLSYRQAAGANHAEDVPHLVRPGWHDLCTLDELADGKPERRLLGGGDSDDVPLFVLRRGDDVVVLSDRCSHLSGPLHEGELSADDSCVVCPWHGSEFRLADGSVRHGPATAPAAAFEVEVADGRVRVLLPGAG
jgi:nitrite reductase/ring-hydroxylating ferredoxin subunit